MELIDRRGILSGLSAFHPRLRRLILLMLTTVAITGIVYRIFISPYCGIATLYQYPAAMDLIAIGCVARLKRPDHISRRGATILATAGLAVMAIVWFSLSVTRNKVFGPTIVAVGTSLVMVAAKFLTLGERRNGWLSFFGRHSYELYLLHSVILSLSFWAVGPLASLPLIWVALYVLACSLLAWTLAKYFSEPANRWIRVHLKPVSVNPP